MTTVVAAPSSENCCTIKAARVLLFFGLSGLQALQSPVMRGTPGDDEQPRMVNRCRRATPLDPRHLRKQPESIVGGDPRDLLVRKADRIGQYLGRIHYV